MTRPVFELAFTAGPEHIDQLGHVNNAVWVQWIQQVAVAHWESVSPMPAHEDRPITGSWSVTRSTISAPAHEGEGIIARTWVGEAPQGSAVRSLNRNSPSVDGKVLRSRARTEWAIIDKALGSSRSASPPKVIAPFISQV